MTSLTPAERNAEATAAAMWEGTVNGVMTLIPSTAAVYLAMKNSPRFLARTNMQSRTALAIMPALFVFAWTAVRDYVASCYYHHSVWLDRFHALTHSCRRDLLFCLLSSFLSLD